MRLMSITGRCETGLPGARIYTVPANITRVTGTHTVYLEFSSGASGNPPYVSLHYFNFPVS
jgi:hypothetical protein